MEVRYEDPDIHTFTGRVARVQKEKNEIEPRTGR